ncbi:MAG: aminotransferase class V-fold PLP-dependent enzyme [Bryobacterales bacterium]|jgi:selenocysteine lyase/cysteine desulfurase|nr:aminotransferase class V-fold PLP-dependent enzyme [Bryobacterales bacterium]
MTIDWQQIRAQFPSLQHSAWLNTATFGQVPLRAQAAIGAHFERRNRVGPKDFLHWFGESDEVRVDIARMFEVTADDVAFIPNTSYALSLMVHALHWEVGDEVLTFENEFPNQIYAPSLLEERGVRLRTASLSRWRAALSHRTKLVALSHTNYATGEHADIDGMADAVHACGGVLYVDGTQTAGVRRVRFGASPPDVYAVNAYKWMNTPPGVGFLLAPADTRQWLQPHTVGWRSHKDWRNVNQLHLGAPEFSMSAERYEGGMLPFVNLFAMRESIRMVLEIGLETVEARVLSLSARVSAALQAAGCTPCHGEEGPGHIVAATLPQDANPGVVAKRLEELNVMVSARHGYLRVSPHYYNNEGDVDAFASALGKVLSDV